MGIASWFSGEIKKLRRILGTKYICICIRINHRSLELQSIEMSAHNFQLYHCQPAEQERTINVREDDGVIYFRHTHHISVWNSMHKKHIHLAKKEVLNTIYQWDVGHTVLRWCGRYFCVFFWTDKSVQIQLIGLNLTGVPINRRRWFLCGFVYHYFNKIKL